MKLPAATTFVITSARLVARAPALCGVEAEGKGKGEDE